MSPLYVLYKTGVQSLQAGPTGPRGSEVREWSARPDAPSGGAGREAIEGVDVNDYSFNFEDDGAEGAGLGEGGQEQGPKWFRDYMANASKEMKSMSAELKALRADKAKGELSEKFRSEGIDPGALALYQGEPDQVDEWLKANKGFLAKLPPAPGEEETETETPSGPPASSVPPEQQDQMRQMQEAGTSGTAAPQGSEAELVASLEAAGPEEYARIMRAHGNRHDWS